MRDTIKQEKLPYTQVVNEIIKDKTISLKAIGLFAFMSHKAQMKDVKWNFTIRSMAKQMKDGEDSIRSGLQELKKCGWITYTKHTNGTGEYLLKASIKPQQGNPDKALDNQNRENPRRETPMKGNPTPINKKDSFNKKDYSSEKLRFDKFRTKYLGKKRGLDTEFDNFIRHRDWEKALTNLERLNLTLDSFNTDDKKYVPALMVFINQRHWEYFEQDQFTNLVSHKTAEENEKAAKERERQQYLEAQAS